MIVPILAACPHRRGFFKGEKKGGNNGSVGAVRISGCQICRQRLLWAGVQSGFRPGRIVRGGGGQECRHTSDQSFYARTGGPLNRQEDTGPGCSSGIWDSIHKPTAQIFQVSRFVEVQLAGSTSKAAKTTKSWILFSPLVAHCSFISRVGLLHISPTPLFSREASSKARRTFCPQTSIIH